MEKTKHLENSHKIKNKAVIQKPGKKILIIQKNSYTIEEINPLL